LIDLAKRPGFSQVAPMSLRAVDLFSGAGGSSVGARSAGAELVAAVDAWDVAAATYRHNFPRALVLNQALGDRSRPPADVSSAKIDLLLASPECTNHSVAKGNKPRDEESLRSAQFVLGWVKALKPRWLVIENVIQMRRWSGYAEFAKDLHKQGYHLTSQVLDASEFGVPQTRRRLFIMGDRDGIPAEVAPPRNARPRDAKRVIQLAGNWPSKPLYTPQRAAGTIARAERAIAALGRRVPFLIVYYGSDGAGGWQPLDRPLRTLTTLDRFGLVTWDGDTPMLRMLQVDELKKGMGFPKDFQMPEGTRREQIMMLGNAVCPPVMEAVVRSLCADLLASKTAA
jgi:DNA (cytosine-5)-methyltransferase 1